MSITNANEGSLFVNQSTASTVQVPEYLTQLFPSLSAQNRNVAVEKYSGLGTPIDQVDLIMGECTCGTFIINAVFLLSFLQPYSFVLLTSCFALSKERGHSRQVGMFNNALKTLILNSIRVNSQSHPPRMGWTLRFISRTSSVIICFVEISFVSSANASAVPAFNNADFDEAFADSFLAFVVSLDPNHTFEPTITPDWNPFSFQQGHQVEMRFNRTASGDPAVSPFTTPEDLLDRCS